MLCSVRWHLMINTHTQCSWGVSQCQSEIQQVLQRWLALHVFQVLAGLQSLALSNRGSGASGKKTIEWSMISIITLKYETKTAELPLLDFVRQQLEEMITPCPTWYYQRWIVHWYLMTLMCSSFFHFQNFQKRFYQRKGWGLILANFSSFRHDWLGLVLIKLIHNLQQIL